MAWKFQISFFHLLNFHWFILKWYLMIWKLVLSSFFYVYFLYFRGGNSILEIFLIENWKLTGGRHHHHDLDFFPQSDSCLLWCVSCVHFGLKHLLQDIHYLWTSSHNVRSDCRQRNISEISKTSRLLWKSKYTNFGFDFMWSLKFP